MLVVREVHSSIVFGEKHGLAVILSTVVVDKTSTGHMSVAQCGIGRCDECWLCGTDSLLLLLNSFTFFTRVQPFCVCGGSLYGFVN